MRFFLPFPNGAERFKVGLKVLMKKTGTRNRDGMAGGESGGVMPCRRVFFSNLGSFAAHGFVEKREVTGKRKVFCLK